MQDPTFAARAADKPEAIDLSHHLSLLARSRQTSPLKGTARLGSVSELRDYDDVG